MDFIFEFEGKKYRVSSASMDAAGDVVRIPDGRFLDIECYEILPPEVKNIAVVEGPYNVPDPSGHTEGHKGIVWVATEVTEE